MDKYDLPVGVVLLSDVIPSLIIKLSAPFFADKISYK